MQLILAGPPPTNVGGSLKSLDRMHFNLTTMARPYFGALVLTTALLTAGGVYSYTQMPNSVYPEVTFPRIAVVAKVPNRDVIDMEVKVTRPLEQAVSTVIGVAQVRSKTIRGGSELSIDFSPGTDMRRAEQLVWNRIGARRSDLPADCELTVEQMTPSVFPILSLVLTSTNPNKAELYDFAYYQLAPQIKNIQDVLYANVAGGDLREIEVIARPADLLAHGLSAADLADQIRQRTQRMPIGRIEGQPLAFQLIVDNQPKTIRQIQNMVIGKSLRVSDVADVRVEHQDRAMSIGFNREDAVVITVFRRLGGNTVNISNAIRKLLARTTLSLPPDDDRKRPPRGIQATVVYDQAQFVATAVNNVRDAILIGGVFSILILLAFLRSWRATLISALAIPTTLAITFLLLHVAGETLNLMSLGGLAVAIGLIIDDTVVVIENIARHLSGDQSHLAKQDNPPAPPFVRGRELKPPFARGRECKPTPCKGGRNLKYKFPPFRRGGRGGNPARFHTPGRQRGGGFGRDYRRRRRLHADDRARVRAAGFHHGRLRAVFRRLELVAVDRGARVDGHQPDRRAGVRGQISGGAAHAGAGTDL